MDTITADTSNIQIGPFDQPDSYRTLAIQVEGRKFYVPRELMAAYSPVFKAMLYGDFAESKKDVIELKEKKSGDIEELLQCLIPMPRQKDIDDKNLQLILDFSDEYQIEELRRRSEVFLMLKMNGCCKSDSKLLNILRVGSKYRLKDLHDCIKRCAMEFTLETLQNNFSHLSCEVIASLMVYAESPGYFSNCTFTVGQTGKDVYCSCHAIYNNGYKQPVMTLCNVKEAPKKEARVHDFLSRMH